MGRYRCVFLSNRFSEKTSVDESQREMTAFRHAASTFEVVYEFDAVNLKELQTWLEACGARPVYIREVARHEGV